MVSETGSTPHHFEAFPVLSSDRLLLREIVPNDLPTILEISFYDGKLAADEAEAMRFLKKTQAHQAQGESVHWGICLRTDDEVIGTCGYYRGYPGNVGEVGYVLKAAYRGQGIMTEAVKRVVEFGLDTMRLANVVAYTSSTNLPSVGVLRRAGFHLVDGESKDLKFARLPDA
jgi:ribosomal-protein-alanine N-acetyltransferase